MSITSKKFTLVASLCCGLVLTALASNNCKVCTSLPCYGNATTCEWNGQSGTPSGTSSYKQCTQGSPGGTDCDSGAATDCNYTCIVNGTGHSSTIQYTPCTHATGTCP